MVDNIVVQKFVLLQQILLNWDRNRSKTPGDARPCCRCVNVDGSEDGLRLEAGNTDASASTTTETIS